MSTTLFVLVVLQGANGLTFSPGYTTAAECVQQYKGPNVACFAYDASGGRVQDGREDCQRGRVQAIHRCV